MKSGTRKLKEIGNGLFTEAMKGYVKECARCGKVHTGGPYNQQEALDKAAEQMAKIIDAEVMETLRKNGERL